ncbi:hypothetical protein F5X97DRAFT_319341 [Nemania serpens]|nr:hypothetical protein F5X97DRAFT_319341 [Nemania serpens]
MAPQMPTPSTLVFDSGTQIKDNCEFLISKDGIVVITSKDPTDRFFRAYAMRCSSEETREVVLQSEPCEDAQKALQSLHTKSCEAVHNHIATNGFSGRRGLKSVFLEPDFEDDDAASIISGHSDSSTAAFSEWGSSGDETMMQKHASDATETSKDRQRNAGRQGSRVSTTIGAHEPAGASRPRAAAPRDFSEYANPAPPRPRIARPGRSHSPSLTARQAPPPPPGHPGHHGSDGPLPPAMRGMAMPPPPRTFPSSTTVGPPSSRPQNMANPPMPSGQPFPYFRMPGLPVDGPPPFYLGHGASRPPKPPSPNANANDGNRDGNNGGGSGPPRPFPVLHPTMRFHTVRITVRWLRHGQHRIIAQCHPTREALQSAAVADVRTNPSAFTSDAKRAASPNSGGGNGRDCCGRPNLRAQVRQAVFAGEAYDMRTFQGQDLSRLFNVMAADDSMPSFEVVVEDVALDTDDDDETEDDGEASVRTASGPAKIERWD